MWLFPHMTKVTCLHSHNFMKNIKITIDVIMPDDYSESKLIKEITAVINQFGGEVCFSSQKEEEK